MIVFTPRFCEAVDGAPWLEGINGWLMDYDLSGVNASFWGEDTLDWAGFAVAGAGDVNKDGYDDFIIGAYGDDDGGGESAGQVYLILGKGAGWAMDTDLSVVAAAAASFIGEEAGDYAGYAVAGAGDVNKDGYDDFIIGAYGHGTNVGQIYLIFGKATGDWAMRTDLSLADASFIGESANSYAGWSVAGAGDVDNDGYDDFIIGAYYHGTGIGKAYLILGKATESWGDINLSAADASFTGEDGGDRAGSAVAGVGDVDNDGYDDFIIGARDDEDGGTAAGQTYLILGKATGSWGDINLSAADASFIGEDMLDQSGDAVAGAGNVNGDDYDDFIIGAHSDDDGGSAAGQVYLILGKATGDWAMRTDLSLADASFIGEDANDKAGWSVAGAGDVNNDGYDDIIIGAHGDDDGGSGGVVSGAGQVYLILGKTSDIPGNWAMRTDLSAADASFWGEDVNDQAGYAVAGAGDVNGDDHDDLIIGANLDDDGDADAGQAYLILSPVFNTAPVANAGADQTDVAEGTQISLSGTCTDDDTEDILTESWTQTAGTSCGTITGADDDSGVSPLTADAFCTAPDIGANETLTFQLECDDGTANHTDTVDVGINAKPTATPQAVSTDEDTAKAITLAGSDPDSEALTFATATDPGNGTLSGLDVNTGAITYTPSANYNGNDSFTFTVNDGVQDSAAATVTITVGAVNDAPVIADDAAESQVSCTLGEDCALPAWTASDADGDSVTTSWAQVSGPSTLQFTGNAIDFANYEYIRGTYYVQMSADDGNGGTDLSILVEVSAPNNPPELSIDDIDVSGATYEDGQFVYSTFTNRVDISSIFTDFDEETLAYSWRIVDDDVNQDTAGFTSTGSGESSLYIRKAGATIVEVSADDGNGGVVTEEIIIYQPVPGMDDISFVISTWEPDGEYTSKVSGQVQSPVWPIVIVNGVRATVTLVESFGSISDMYKSGDTNNDTYNFTATDVPDGDNPLELTIQIITDVDNADVELIKTLVSAQDTGTGPLSRLVLDANYGCSLSAGESQVNGWMMLVTLFLFAVMPMGGLICLRKIRMRDE